MKRLHTIIPRRVGLARALSKLGYCSRSQGFELIRAGRVKLNDRTRRDPECPVNLEKDRIEVDHQQVSIKARIYLMLNKPRGVVTTASDEKGRKTVYSCLVQNLDPIIRRQELPFVAPVGRLDKASEGLLLLTNDSEWSARVLAPETHLHKVYHVQVDRIVDTLLLQSLIKGVNNFSASKPQAFCGKASAIRGSKLCWTRARTGTSGVCSSRLESKCCGSCEWASDPSHWVIFRKVPLGRSRIRRS